MLTLRRLLGWPRATRGVMLAWLLVGSVGLSALDWLAFGRIDLTLHLGLRIEWVDPWWRAALLTAYDVLLLTVAAARLHDLSLGGWWLLVLLGVAALAVAVPAVGLVMLVLWFALLLWPGTIGPNRFGPDPRGWESREHYERQRAELARR